MSVLKTLRERVAPELNHLYTAPPSEIPGGIDYGWHGREHALHTFLVARMFGATAELCTGDFAVLSRFVPPLTSMDRNDDHAWCSINGVAPVDLSMTFKHYGNAPQLRGAIVGEGRNGDWDVQYADDESVLDENVQNQNEIIFIEKTIREDPAEALVNDPYLLLHPPRPDDASSWHTLYGPAIYAKITVYCFGCASGGAKSIRHRMPRQQAAAWIAENTPEPEAQILKVLGGAAGRT
jgi:hypothetical protein